MTRRTARSSPDALTRGLERSKIECCGCVPGRAPLLTVGEILRWPGSEGARSNTSRARSRRRSCCLEVALKAFERARRREGERIAELLEKRNAANHCVARTACSRCSDGAQQRYRDKLRERLDRLDVQAEPERLEQELALIAQRIDVSEEVDRLEGPRHRDSRRRSRATSRLAGASIS